MYRENFSRGHIAFQALSPIERRTLDLYYFSDPQYSLEAIAAILEEHVATTKKRLMRAKGRLKTGLIEKYRRRLFLEVAFAMPEGNLVRWYPGSDQTGLMSDRSYYADVPKQRHSLSRYFGDFHKMKKVEAQRTYALGGIAPPLAENTGIAILEYVDEGHEYEFERKHKESKEIKFENKLARITYKKTLKVGLTARRLKARPCGNPQCPDKVLLLGRLPEIEECPLCETLEKLGIVLQCPFCQTEEYRRRLCEGCANDAPAWLAEWQKHRTSKRFHAFERWDYNNRCYKPGWCFDLTKAGLWNMPKSALFPEPSKSQVRHEVHENEKIRLVIYRDQPVFTMEQVMKLATPPWTHRTRTEPAPLTVQAVVHEMPVFTRTTEERAEDMRIRQLTAMRGYQARAKTKFKIFARGLEGRPAEEIKSLFALAHPADAKLCEQRLCRRCGLFVGGDGFICGGCKP